MVDPKIAVLVERAIPAIEPRVIDWHVNGAPIYANGATLCTLCGAHGHLVKDCPWQDDAQ